MHPTWLIINISLILTGFVLIVLALIGIYVGKIFNEVQGRPFYVINEVIEVNLEEEK